MAKQTIISIFLVALIGYGMALAPINQEKQESEHAPKTEGTEEPYCFICQLIVVTVEMQILGNNATMEEIVNAVSSACDALGGPDSQIVATCHNLVETYLEQIIDMITVQFFQPYDVCVKLQACP